MIRFTGFCLATILLVGCSQGNNQTDTTADVEVFNQLREQELGVFTSGQSQGWASIVTDDCMVMPPNEPVILGHRGATGLV